MRLGTGGGKQIGRTSQLEGGIRKKMAQERVGDAGGGGAGVSADDDDLGPLSNEPNFLELSIKTRSRDSDVIQHRESSLFSCRVTGHRDWLVLFKLLLHPGEIHACSPRAQVGCWPAIMIGGWLSLPLDRILPPETFFVIDLMHGAYSLGV